MGDISQCEFYFGHGIKWVLTTDEFLVFLVSDQADGAIAHPMPFPIPCDYNKIGLGCQWFSLFGCDQLDESVEHDAGNEVLIHCLDESVANADIR